MWTLKRTVQQLSRFTRDGAGQFGASPRDDVVQDVLPVAALSLAMTAAYGLGLGIFGLSHGLASWRIQLVASVVKIPVWTLMMFVVTCPAFFAANALSGLRLSPEAAFRLCAATFTVFAAVLGVFAPITGMVSFACNYSFTILINAAMIGIAGLTAVTFLGQIVLRLAREIEASPTGSRLRLARPLIAFAAWAVVFALVGAEFGWRMRPLVGWREEPFAWYRSDSMTLWQGIQSEIFNIITSGGA